MALRMLNYIVQFYQSFQKNQLLAANAWPAVFPVVLYNGDREWNAKTEIAQCIENKSIPEKYIPQICYYLIDISKVYNQEMDALVASVVYAEQHSEDNKREDYLKNLENLAQKIIPSELKEAFAGWFMITFTGIIEEQELEQFKYSLEEREGNMLATLGERIYNEGTNTRVLVNQASRAEQELATL